MKKILLILFFLSLPGLAQADITLNLTIGQLFKKDGSTPLANNSTLVLLVDTLQNGFGDLISPHSFTPGIDDLLLAHFPSNDILEIPGTSQNVIFLDFDGSYRVYDPMLLVWYDKPFNVNDQGPGYGVDFGFYRSDTPDIYADIGWNVPADGSTVALHFITESLAENSGVSGGNPNFFGIAQYQTQVVPEPVSCLLALIGGGTMFMRRRLSRFKNSR